MTAPAAGRQHAVPMVMLYVGMPAYFVVVALVLRDTARSHSTPVTVFAFVSAALFSVVFLWLGLSTPRPGSDRTRLRAVVGLGVLSAGVALTGNTTTVFFAAVAAMAGDQLAPRVATRIIVLSAAAVTAANVVDKSRPADLVAQSAVTLIVGLFTMATKRLADTNEALEVAREEVARLAVTNERLRFARDLHDLLGHTLTVIRAKSELATRLAPDDPSGAEREMAEVELLARQALHEVRDTVTGYRRSTVATEIAGARIALSSAGIACEVSADVLDVPEEADDALGWVLREAVTNVVRHSGAGRCRMLASGDDDGFVLEVVDDGRGPPGADGAGTGLRGMRERLAAVGGALEVSGAPGGGCQVVARVPAVR